MKEVPVRAAANAQTARAFRAKNKASYFASMVNKFLSAWCHACYVLGKMQDSQ